jgi:single-strand DNA-binding protein
MSVEARVVEDPELRFTAAGMAVGKLRLVASDRKKNPDSGQWEDGKSLWIDVTMFKQLAENTVESVTKGDLVVVTGKLSTDEWTDRETGAKRSKITMVADTVAVSLAFRTVRHGEGRAARAGGQPSGQSVTDDPWSSAPVSPRGFADDPPF